jgi:hypothetical protein
MMNELRAIEVSTVATNVRLLTLDDIIRTTSVPDGRLRKWADQHGRLNSINGVRPHLSG